MANSRSILDAMWRGDTDLLDEIAPCRCCCEEHTDRSCPARAWYGCRGLFSDDAEEWFLSYQRVRGMSRSDFFG